ncbi:peptide ABC transporter substrate-binding protein, partial [Lactobacillus sp. XV13L]|nr:peptide ABC transporter substrate-binding protein [Lactobacillus sp. XV13L]
SNTAHELFEQNKLDDAIVNGVVAKNLQNDKNLIHEHKGGTYILRANLRNNRPLANQKMRQAVSLAIDRTSLTKNILADGSTPAYTYTAKNVAIDPTTKKDFGSEVKPKYTYNPRLARELWQQGKTEAGIKGQVNLELIGDDEGITKNSAEFIQAALQKNLPQLKVSIKNIPDKSVTTAVRAGKFDAHQTLWLADFADPI